jgi:hypothetical protein
MTKKMTDFLDNKGFVIQKCSYKQNMIDSNFLTTNLIYQKLVLGDDKWFNGNGLDYMGHQARGAFSHEKGTMRRYWKNFDSLIGANPVETKLYTNPNHVSRDNSMGYIMMLGKLGLHSDARAILFNMIKRGSFFQNTHTVKGEKKVVPDLCGPEQYAVILRSCFSKNILLLLFPLLLLLDCFFLLNVIVHVAKSFYDPTHTSTCHHELSAILQNRDTYRTPASYIAEKLYLYVRKPVPEFPDKEPVVSAVKYYSRVDYDAPIYETTARVVEYLKK